MAYYVVGADAPRPRSDPGAFSHPGDDRPMLELLIAAVAGGVSHLKTRDYTRRRLRFTPVGANPALSGVAAGVGTALITAPLLGLLPVVGTTTALVLGVGVGTGVLLGARRGGGEG